MSRGHLTSSVYPLPEEPGLHGSRETPRFYNARSDLLGSHTDDSVITTQKQFDNNSPWNMPVHSAQPVFPRGYAHTSQHPQTMALHCENERLTHEDRVCLPVPFFHCFGCVLGVMAVLTHRSTMVIVEEFDALMVLEAIHKERATAVYGVPTMYIAELNHPMFDQFDLTSLPHRYHRWCRRAAGG